MWGLDVSTPIEAINAIVRFNRTIQKCAPAHLRIPGLHSQLLRSEASASWPRIKSGATA